MICALKTFCHVLVNKTVQVLTDNISVVAYIKHLGGPAPALSHLIEVLWSEAVQIGVKLCAKHLSGVFNTQAIHYLSRLSPAHEWCLNPWIAQCRLLCHNEQCTITNIQFLHCGSLLLGGRCIRADVDGSQQLHQSAVEPVEQGCAKIDFGQSQSNSHLSGGHSHGFRHY